LPHGAAAALWTDSVPEAAEPATLVRVIDGDTIEVRLAHGTTDTVRMILVDTPETKKPNTPVECFGQEASAFTSWLLSLAPDGTVYLEKDVSERDQYDRLLRYVWVDLGGDPYLVSEAIARSGFGALATFPPGASRSARRTWTAGTSRRAASRSGRPTRTALTATTTGALWAIGCESG
jgi:micrococcal nuclease